MGRRWIDEGLQHRRGSEEHVRRAAERRLHEASVIKEKGPALMRQLAEEIGAAVAEYREKAVAGDEEIVFEELPGGGFSVERRHLPSIALECRPDYEAHVIYCNMARTDNQETDVRESVFNLHFAVDEAGHVRFRDETGHLRGVDETGEFLLKPVLFPGEVAQGPGTRSS